MAAERNLKWGLAVLLLALGLLGAALVIDGARSLLPMVVCLVTFTILWAMARLRIFHQRNGVFFATAMVCLLGAIIPLVERGYLELDRLVHTGRPASVAAVETTSEIKPAEQLPVLVEAFKVKPPIDAAIETVRIVDDVKVAVGPGTYLLRAGDTFPLDDIKDGQVIFQANELRLTLPEAAVELIRPKRQAAPLVKPAAPKAVERPASYVSDQELPADMTERANTEVVRRYPQIGVKDSPENILFRERVAEFKAERPEFFDEPDWPIYLAEGLAKEQGWIRAE